MVGWMFYTISAVQRTERERDIFSILSVLYMAELTNKVDFDFARKRLVTTELNKEANGLTQKFIFP